MSAALTTRERQAILDGLDSPDAEVRRLSAEQLLLLPMGEAVAALSRCLGDVDWRVRKTAVERLVRCHHERPVQEMLVRSLADGENPGRRNAAFEALVGCGARMTPRLVLELGNDDVDVRKQVVDALAAIGDPASRIPLRESLDDADANVRGAAAEALGVVGGDDDIAPLLALATRAGEEVLVQLSALRALSDMGVSVGVASLGDALERPLLRPAALELLGHSADPMAIDALLKGLGSGRRSSREGAISALLRRLSQLDDEEAEDLAARMRSAALANESLIDRCCERLEQAELGACIALIQFLGLVGDHRAVLPVLRAGRDEAIEELSDRTLVAMGAPLLEALEVGWDSLDAGLRVRACRLLGRVGGEGAERLVASALTATDPALRCAAAAAIGDAGFFDRIPELVQQLETTARERDFDGEEEIEQMIGAIVALAEHPDASRTGADLKLVELLASRLAGASEPLRLAIAQVIGCLGCEPDEALVGYLLKDPSPGVRRAAVQTLERVAFDRACEALRLALGDEAGAVRIAAVRVLGRHARAEAAEDLARQMGDEDTRVVSAALKAWGRIHWDRDGSVEGLEEVLAPALAREALVALAAIEALTEIGGAQAARLAATTLGRPEPELVKAGVACVGAHGDEATLSELLPLLAHDDWSVRAEVVQVVAVRAFRKGLPAVLRRLELEDDPFVREVVLRTVEQLED
jgi:HEAT repeat protein